MAQSKSVSRRSPVIFYRQREPVELWVAGRKFRIPWRETLDRGEEGFVVPPLELHEVFSEEQLHLFDERA